MGNKPYVRTYLMTEPKTNGGLKLRFDEEEKTNNEITEIIDNCLSSVKQILSDGCWKKLLKDSSLYLSEHSSMPKEKMEELYNEIPSSRKNTPSKDFYQNALKNF